MHRGKRYRMSVNDFAYARGATRSIASKQEAEKVWEPKFIAEIASGKDPRITPTRDDAESRPATVAQLLKLYRERYVDAEPLKSRSAVISQLRVLTAELGQLPAKAHLAPPEAICSIAFLRAGVRLAQNYRRLRRAPPLPATGSPPPRSYTPTTACNSRPGSSPAGFTTPSWSPRWGRSVTATTTA